MSEYKRFVSYIYEYRDNEKSKNCGFSRVEVRNHQCRMEVHMKLPAYPFTPVFRVYAFVPSDQQLLGIPLGKANYHQGAVYGIFTVPDRNINGQSYGIEDLGGIYILTDNGQCFATAWKEIAIRPEVFLLPDGLPQVQAASLETVPPQYPETYNDRNNDTEENNLPENNTPENNTLGNRIPDNQIPERRSPENNFADDRFPERRSPGNNFNDDNSPGRNIPANSNNISDRNTSASPDTAYTPDAPTTSDNFTSPNNALAEPSQEASPESPWEKIQDTYPHAQPFFDDDIHQCVQLSLKDIPQICRYGIPVGVNQFLVHGCQSYQHFLLGKSCSSADGEYIVAVPGLYDEKEQFLASMFGFPNFKPARNNSIRPGQFGYWYRFLY